ncbi:hypothetical protein AAG570_004535 [Ranatra chinensis]|uniref:Protein kinase domain-containing protein n=1 Tax=Ranatra chinensis TaxID=642074 RepID=A0ABD0YFU0_9HEMI
MFKLGDCLTIVNRALGEEEANVEVEGFRLEKSHSAGFLGETEVLKIRVKSCAKNVPHELSFFVKRLPKGNREQEALVRELDVYTKEIGIYENVLRPLEGYFSEVYPRMYLAKDNEVLVMEDLAALGFSTVDTHKLYDFEKCEAVVKALGKFHAMTLVTEKLNGTKLPDFIPDRFLRETLFICEPSNALFKYVKVGIRVVDAIIVKHFPEVSPEVRGRIEALLESLWDGLNPSLKFRNVLTHGDLWANNVMFSYNSQGTVKEVKIVDFQLVRYYPPAFDVLMLLHLTTSQDFRSKHSEALMLTYHLSLRHSLSHHSICIDDILPWSELVASANHLIPIVRAIAVTYQQWTLLPTSKIDPIMKDPELYNHIVTVDRVDLVLETIQDNENYRRRVLEAVSDIVDCVQNRMKH